MILFKISELKIASYFNFLFFILIFILSSNALADEPNKGEAMPVPYELLAEHRRDDVKDVVTNYSIFRVFHNVQLKNDLSIARFMMDHPVFLSATLKSMKIRDYLVHRDNHGMYVFDDRKGVKARFETIYSTDGKRFYYGIAKHHGFFLKLLGRGMVALEFRGEPGDPAKTFVNANVYAKIDNVVIDLLIKILKPFVMPMIDRKIQKFIKETQKLALEISTHPGKVYETVKKSGLADEAELEQFRRLISNDQLAMNNNEKQIHEVHCRYQINLCP